MTKKSEDILNKWKHDYNATDFVDYAIEELDKVNYVIKKRNKVDYAIEELDKLLSSKIRPSTVKEYLACIESEVVK